MDTLTLKRSKGKSTFKNVSKELLTLYLDIDGDLERVGLFDEETYQYFWDYDNKGLKLAQLRFYPIPTDVSSQYVKIFSNPFYPNDLLCIGGLYGY